MKTILHRIVALTALVFSFTWANAHEEIATGPNGGRLLTVVDPHVEFLVTAERKVQITFVGEEGKAVAPGEQAVVVTTGERAAPTKLTFVKSGDKLVSETVLPEGNKFPTVVQIKITPDAKPVYARFVLNMTICGECKKPEYACICGH